MYSFLNTNKTTGSSRNNNIFFQPKLAVNQPNDVYEQEADAVADKVMRMPDPSANNNSFFKPAITSVQRKCAHCEEEEKKAQRKENSNAETVASSQTENYINTVSGGRSLSKSERSFFEPRFGYDFSNVQLHTNAAANESAKDINALAYTSGNNIVFGANQYQPETANGKRLMAHELTHVVQQNSGSINRKIIQRLDDASFEASAGVDQGKTNGTMTADAIAGQSYNVDCGFQNYGVTFSFPKAYKGIYPYQAASRDVKGVYIKMQASLNDRRYCGRYTPLRLLQTVRKITKNSSGDVESADWNNTVRNQRSGWNDTNAPSRGWMVDRVTSASVPFYTSGPNALEGSETTPATLYDSPGFWTTDSNVGMEFYTSAVCEDASHKRWVAASVSWGFYTDSSGTISFRPATPVATCGNPQEVQDASARWDAIAGNTHTGITFK